MGELNGTLRKDALKPGLIFDGDDTVWASTERYAKAFDQFADAVSYLGFPKEYVLQVRDRVDMKNTNERGYSAANVIHSFVEAYEFLCEEKGEPAKPDVAEQITKIAANIFEGEFSFYPGVREWLEYFKQNGYAIGLLTSGDTGTHHKKLADTRAEEVFGKSGISVVRKKTKEEYDKLMAATGMDPENTVMVGNSEKSDGYTATVDAGIYAIIIPKKTWAGDVLDEKKRAEIPKDKYFEAKSFADIPEILGKIKSARETNKNRIKSV